jgi:hypothetical protein
MKQDKSNIIEIKKLSTRTLKMTPKKKRGWYLTFWQYLRYECSADNRDVDIWGQKATKNSIRKLYLVVSIQMLHFNVNVHIFK